MTIPSVHERSAYIYSCFCEALVNLGVKFNKDDESFRAFAYRNGKDIETDIIVAINADDEWLGFSASLNVNFPKAKMYEAVVILNVINSRIAEGRFHIFEQTGIVVFCNNVCFENRVLNKEFVEKFISYSVSLCREIDKKLHFYISNEEQTLEEFLQSCV